MGKSVEVVRDVGDQVAVTLAESEVRFVIEILGRLPLSGRAADLRATLATIDQVQRKLVASLPGASGVEVKEAADGG